MQAYDISLDMKKAPGRIERTVTVRRGDNDTQQIRASITAGGQPYTPKGTARLDIMHADGTWARCSASVSGSTATCTLPSAALNGVGRCRAAHFVFTDGAKVESTEGFALVIQPDIDSNGSEQAKDYDDELNQMNQKWTKLNAEAERAERDRVAKEAERVSAEADRKSRETERASAESDRKAAESERKRAEDGRKASETSRADKERERIAAETARAEAERGRASAETARARAESARADAQAKNNADQALNNEQMKKLSPVILQEGQYDRATLKPTIEGEPNRMYFVPMVAPAAIELYDLTAKQVEAGNLYVEWMWLDGKWEQMGQTEMKVKPISTASIDSVFAGEHPTGEDVLNLTGLDYTHGKVSALLDGKAGKSHVHAVADVDGLQAALDGKWNKGETIPPGNVYLLEDKLGDLDSRLGAVERGGGLRILYEETKTITYEGDGRLYVDVNFASFANNAQGRFVCAVLDVPRIVSNINQVSGFPDPTLTFTPSGVDITVSGSCQISPTNPYATGEFLVRLTVYGYKE